MRLPISIGTGILILLSFSLPNFAEAPAHLAQARPVKNTVQLKMNQKLWNKQNITNYRYTLTRSCFCTPEARGPVLIEVRNGVPTRITSVATGQPIDPALFKDYGTIPKLFNTIQDAVARKADSLTVKYNRQSGYPTQINIDYSSQIADEELYLTVENFQRQ